MKSVYHCEYDIFYFIVLQLGESPNKKNVKKKWSGKSVKVGGSLPELEKVLDSTSLTRRKYFQKLGLIENILENIIG